MCNPWKLLCLNHEKYGQWLICFLRRVSRRNTPIPAVSPSSDQLITKCINYWTQFTYFSYRNELRLVAFLVLISQHSRVRKWKDNKIHIRLFDKDGLTSFQNEGKQWCVFSLSRPKLRALQASIEVKLRNKHLLRSTRKKPVFDVCVKTKSRFFNGKDDPLSIPKCIQCQFLTNKFCSYRLFIIFRRKDRSNDTRNDSFFINKFKKGALSSAFPCTAFMNFFLNSFYCSLNPNPFISANDTRADTKGLIV
jgi:hypothetical protein